MYSTRRTATERENLGIWARDSLVMRKGALRHARGKCGECKRHSACYSLGTQVVVSADTR
jgi:hypothetical protein